MSGGDPLQFDRVEQPGRSPCSRCKQPLGATYFQANGKIICASCRAALESEWSGGSPASRFVRAVVFGVAAALLGAGMYFGFSALTGWELGLIAIVVGFLVGHAVKKGGPAYQALAIFLTYSAIVFSYGIGTVKYMFDNPDKVRVLADSAAVRDSAQAVAAGTAPDSAAAAARQRSLAGFLTALVVLLGLLYALPFLGGAGNIIGLVIIAIGLYEAWVINKRGSLALSGPYQVGAAPSSEPAAS
jgi:hypothetical protein